MDSDDESNGDGLSEMVEDYHAAFKASYVAGDSSDGGTPKEPNNDAANFFQKLRDNEKKLFLDCKYIKLSFIVKLLHIKCLSGWTNKSFTILLQFLNDALSKAIGELPNSFYEAKKMIPITPRLKRLFMSKKTASYMTWHYDKCIDDGVLRHLVDFKVWKTFDEIHKSFSLEKRNVRLGLASDGFNPFENMSTSNSVWLVVLVPYNLPPWMCMKQPYFMLSLIILGLNGLGNKIDIYLQPLVDELKQLWEVGVTTFDTFKNQNFNMHASILWTINNFLAYSNLSGWNTMGALACPSCHNETHSSYLKMEESFVSWGIDASCQLSIDGDWNLKNLIVRKSLVYPLNNYLEMMCLVNYVIMNSCYLETQRRRENMIS